MLLLTPFQSFASKNVCPDPTSTRLYFRQGGATSLKDCPLFLTQHQVHPALATSYIDSYEEIEQSRVYFQEAGILEQSRPSLDLCLRKFGNETVFLPRFVFVRDKKKWALLLLIADSENRADPYFRFLLSDCVFNGNHRSRVEMNYKCLASWKADYASEENDGKVHVFIGITTLALCCHLR